MNSEHWTVHSLKENPWTIEIIPQVLSGKTLQSYSVEYSLAVFVLVIVVVVGVIVVVIVVVVVLILKFILILILM